MVCWYQGRVKHISFYLYPCVMHSSHLTQSRHLSANMNWTWMAVLSYLPLILEECVRFSYPRFDHVKLKKTGTKTGTSLIIRSSLSSVHVIQSSWLRNMQFGLIRFGLIGWRNTSTAVTMAFCRIYFPNANLGVWERRTVLYPQFKQIQLCWFTSVNYYTAVLDLELEKMSLSMHL